MRNSDKLEWWDNVSGREFKLAKQQCLQGIVNSMVDSRYKIYYGNTSCGTVEKEDINKIKSGYIIKVGDWYYLKSRKTSSKISKIDVENIVRIVDTQRKRDVLKHENFNFWCGLKAYNDGIVIKDVFNTEIMLHWDEVNEKVLEKLPLIILYNDGNKVCINDCLKDIKLSTGLMIEVDREHLYKSIESSGKMTETLESMLDKSRQNVGVLFMGNTVLSVNESLQRLINFREYILGHRDFK